MRMLNRLERPYIYGFSGSSKRLLDASMVIWNLVGIVALVGLIGWIRERGLLPAFRPPGGSEGGRGTLSGRKSRLTMPFSQMAHARAVVGDETSEDILERELQRSGMRHQGPDDLIRAEMEHARAAGDETSEDILERELKRSGTRRQPVDDTPTSEDILRSELADARGQGEGA
jgi:hypothetical protein